MNHLMFWLASRTVVEMTLEGLVRTFQSLLMQGLSATEMKKSSVLSRGHSTPLAWRKAPFCLILGANQPTHAYDYVIIVYGTINNINGGARTDLHVLWASGDAPSTNRYSSRVCWPWVNTREWIPESEYNTRTNLIAADAHWAISRVVCVLRLVSMADSRNERLRVLIGIDYDSIAPGAIRTKLPASIRPSFIAFFFFQWS